MSDVSFVHVHLDRTVTVTSTLSGRTVVVNPVFDRFAVLPGFTLAAILSVRNGLSEELSKTYSGNKRRVYGKPRRLIDGLLSSQNISEYAAAVDAIAASLVDKKRPMVTGSNLVLAKALVLSVKHGLLAFPVGEVSDWRFLKSPSMPACESRWYGAIALVVDEMREAELTPQARKRYKKVHAQSVTLRLLLSISGIHEVGDMGPEVWKALQPVVSDPTFATFTGSARKRIAVSIDAVLRSQQRKFATDPQLASLIPRNAGALREKLRAEVSPGYDENLMWMEEQFPAYSEWRVAAATYLSSLEQLLSMRRVVSHVRTVFSALLEDPELPPSPLEFCLHAQRERSTAALKRAIDPRRVDTGERDRNPAYVASLLITTRGLFDLFLATHARLSDGARDSRYCNPTDAIAAPRVRRKGRTHRKAMPAKLQELVIRVLTEPQQNPVSGRWEWTFAWARSLKSDQFQWVNPESRAHEQVWSPVRALAILLMLYVPLRSFQTRMLGSGEGDSEVWSPDPDNVSTGRWVRNQSQWAPPAGDQRADGFLRRMRIAESEQIGLHISTNKTADRAGGWANIGYDIPWVPKEVFEIVGRLITFQRTYNPALAPKSRTQLATLKDAGTTDLQGVFSPMHYLFRDAAYAPFPDEPVLGTRLSWFWEALCERVELEAAKHGVTVRMVKTLNTYGRPEKLEYDLHSLRVTGVTRLAMSGCPLEVIAALVGHATIVMTVHYVHLTPEYVHERLESAFEKTRVPVDGVHATWKELEDGGSLSELRELFVGHSNSDETIDELRSAQSWLVRQMDIGICPNGGTMCSTGGEVIKKNKATGDEYGPVPGGCANCAACRFLWTGPAFLGGLVARFNALGVEIVVLRERVATCEAAYAALKDEQDAAHALGETFNERRFLKQQEMKDMAEVALMDAGERQAALLRRVVECSAMLDKLSADGTKPTLLISGRPVDLERSIQNMTPFELYNRVCLDSEIFAIDSTEADRRRWKDISRILANSEVAGVPVGLSDEELKRVGNELYKLWKLKVGGDGVQDLLDGQSSLVELGLVNEVRTILEKIAIPSFQMLSVIGKRTPELLLASKIDRISGDP